MENQEKESCTVEGLGRETPYTFAFHPGIGAPHRLIKKAQQMGLLSSLSKGSDNFRISMYANDAALFITPSDHDFKTINEILKIFSVASGLQVNVNKTELFPITCDVNNLPHIRDSGMNVSKFPCKYLGLPLHHRKPSKAMMQPVIQKIVDRLPGWKRQFFSYPGRELLVKYVLLAMPTFSYMFTRCTSGLL
jgi:hypothetical protein